jgi:hypothetical protein
MVRRLSLFHRRRDIFALFMMFKGETSSTKRRRGSWNDVRCIASRGLGIARNQFENKGLKGKDFKPLRMRVQSHQKRPFDSNLA